MTPEKMKECERLLDSGHSISQTAREANVQESTFQLLPLNKLLTDAVKMIACRAETALVALLMPVLRKEEEARALVRQLLIASADIEQDDTDGTLTVRIHHMTTPAHDKAIASLLEKLAQLEFHHPETDQNTWSTRLSNPTSTKKVISPCKH